MLSHRAGIAEVVILGDKTVEEHFVRPSSHLPDQDGRKLPQGLSHQARIDQDLMWPASVHQGILQRDLLPGPMTDGAHCVPTPTGDTGILCPQVVRFSVSSPTRGTTAWTERIASG